MKYALRFKWVLALILGGLLISTVLATGGAYNLFWSVDGGGAMFSSGGSYSLGGTIGQPDAGRLSGGRYVLGGGFLGGSTVVPPPRAVYLPLIALARPAPPNCGDVEDNDTKDQARPLLVIGTPCTGSLQDDPAGEDDYYWVDLAAGKRISIDLTQIPAGADYDLYLYDAQGRVVASSNNSNQADEHIPAYANTSTRTARYFIRINMYQKSTIAYNAYLLKVVVS